MTFDEYQIKSTETAIYPKVGGSGLIYPLLGLSGETGEVCDKFKKIIRDKGGVISEDDKNGLVLEIGDLLWYIAQISRELGVSLGEVAELNIQKLADRKSRNAIGGSGDNR